MISEMNYLLLLLSKEHIWIPKMDMNNKYNYLPGTMLEYFKQDYPMLLKLSKLSFLVSFGVVLVYREESFKLYNTRVDDSESWFFE